MALDISMLTNLGLPQILLWLLSFAVIYGVLSQVGEKGIPKDRAARAIISIVVAFFVLLAAQATALISILSQLSSAMVLIVIAIIVFIAFLEVANVRVHMYKGKRHPQTGEKLMDAVSVFEKHGYVFAIAILIIVVLVFVAAGGLNLIGIPINLTGTASITLLFFVVIIIAILWMLMGGKEE